MDWYHPSPWVYDRRDAVRDILLGSPVAAVGVAWLVLAVPLAVVAAVAVAAHRATGRPVARRVAWRAARWWLYGLALVAIGGDPAPEGVVALAGEVGLGGWLGMLADRQVR